MNIHYANGCLSLRDVSALDKMPKTAARKVVKLLARNRYADGNETCFEIIREWLYEKIEEATRKSKEHDIKAEKALKFYTSLQEVIS